MKYKLNYRELCVALLLLTVILCLATGCAKENNLGSSDDSDSKAPETGYVSGTIKNDRGIPMEGVRVLIDHSIFFNSDLSTITDDEGKYKIKVPAGSWYAFAQHTAKYNGKNFTFYLHPENAGGFGNEGAVRNFVWKLSGDMPQPLSGYYGGLVTIDSFPGVYINVKEIDFIFTPLTPLIDGSEGKILHRISKDNHRILDVPIGKYQLTARYQGKSLKFRTWNSEQEFQETYHLDFLPQVTSQCDNCAKIEYYWEP